MNELIKAIQKVIDLDSGLDLLDNKIHWELIQTMEDLKEIQTKEVNND